MKSEIVRFFTLQRQIFGSCPKCEEIFRLSDCQIYLKKKPVMDWMHRLNLESERLAEREAKIDEKEEEMREKAREKGRQKAKKVIKKIDRIFAPRKLNPDDSKVLFHPIDYIVFNGMKSANAIKNIVLLDRKVEGSSHRQLQRSIERAVERENYEWQTLRVLEDGKIKLE